MVYENMPSKCLICSNITGGCISASNRCKWSLKLKFLFFSFSFRQQEREKRANTHIRNSVDATVSCWFSQWRDDHQMISHIDPSAHAGTVHTAASNLNSLNESTSSDGSMCESVSEWVSVISLHNFLQPPFVHSVSMMSSFFYTCQYAMRCAK